MLILATVGIAVTAVSLWSTIHGQNGFTEVTKMLRGEPAFVVIDSPTPSGGSDSQESDDNYLRDQKNQKGKGKRTASTGSQEIRDRSV